MESSFLSLSLSSLSPQTFSDSDGKPSALFSNSSDAVTALRGASPYDTLVGTLDGEEASLTGTTVAGTYRVLERIGKGAMGRVYEVEHARTGRRLALKVLARDKANDPHVAGRFLAEAKAISRLHARNTVQVFDHGVSNALAYIVMERVHGATVGALLEGERRFSERRALRIAAEICDALVEAHEQGVIHRDIKPDNVMIERERRTPEGVKVLDFGLAKVRATSSAEAHVVVSAAGTVLGTPHYMAPEQIRGGAVDARTDVYGVGALLYRMLTGKRPFRGNASAVMTAHLTRMPISPEVRAPSASISAEASAIVMMALAKDPTDRFESAAALANALRSAIEGAPQGANDRASFDDSSVALYESALRASRFGAAMVFVVAFLLAGALGLTWFFFAR